MTVFKGTALTLATIATAAFVPVAAHEREIPDYPPEYAFVCPDGGYESGCDLSDLEQAVDLEGAGPSAFVDRCLFRTEADCAVLASGRINRSSGEPALHWQLLELQATDGPRAEMLVLAELDEVLPAVLFAHQVDGYFDAPVAARNDAEGFLLHVPARNRGLGNADLMLYTSGSGWNWSTAAQLMAGTDRLLPEGFTITSPVSFNFREGSAFGLVRRDTDSGCCATGGFAIIDLEQSQNSLSVSSVTFNETNPSGNRHGIHQAGEHPQ